MVNELLGRGRDDAIDVSTICFLMGMTRQGLKEDIEKDRKEGHPILRCFVDGEPSYYLAGTPGELREFLGLFGRMVPKDIQKTLLAGIYDLPSTPRVNDDNGGWWP